MLFTRDFARVTAPRPSTSSRRVPRNFPILTCAQSFSQFRRCPTALDACIVKFVYVTVRPARARARSLSGVVRVSILRVTTVTGNHVS